MSKICINGGKRLKGEIDLQGAKNSVLPVLAATLLCSDKCVIHNCPSISDVDTSLETEIMKQKYRYVFFLLSIFEKFNTLNNDE